MDGAAVLQSEPVRDMSVHPVQRNNKEQCDGGLQAHAGLLIHQISQYLKALTKTGGNSGLDMEKKTFLFIACHEPLLFGTIGCCKGKHHQLQMD